MARPKLLVVDAPEIGRVVGRALRGTCDVETEAHPGRALARVAAGERFDALLVELDLVEMSGLELHRRVAALAPALAARTLLVAGALAEDDVPTTGGAGAPPCLAKPIGLGALRAAVARALFGEPVDVDV